MAMALVDAEGILEPSSAEFLQKASYCARLGSGSASRSVYGEPGIWGETSAFAGSSDEYAVPFTENIHPDLQNWTDAVMIVDAGEKSVSSTEGHALLSEHAYAQSRFQQAQKNLEELLQVLQNGNIERFIALVESEALQLHAMMMSSIPYYMLMRPHTISIIQEIWQFRRESQLPICFTLDAGANVHVLYDTRYQEDIQNFINTRLLSYCQNGLYLCSATGGRPEKL
jgi:diphosphomevalonate decarboxylase